VPCASAPLQGRNYREFVESGFISPLYFLIAVLFARCKDATTVNLLKAVLSDRCEDATIANFLIAFFCPL
jgi:hypothetical protein